MAIRSIFVVGIQYPFVTAALIDKRYFATTNH